MKNFGEIGSFFFRPPRDVDTSMAMDPWTGKVVPKMSITLCWGQDSPWDLQYNSCHLYKWPMLQQCNIGETPLFGLECGWRALSNPVIWILHVKIQLHTAWIEGIVLYDELKHGRFETDTGENSRLRWLVISTANFQIASSQWVFSIGMRSNCEAALAP